MTSDTLYISWFVMDPDRTVVSYPTNYDDNQVTQSAGGTSTGMATRGIAASASDNPGQFDMGNNGPWAAYTIAIRGSGGAAGENRQICRCC